PIEGRGVVYQDKKPPAPRLGALVKAIVQKLKAYQPIEGRGVVYQDKKPPAPRLGALVKAIVQKLKA
ncbi:hypothetical protein, partial [Hymenobacter coccineus]|uniref:hypothetical protein n=1 Tax=Hymenobacter coccineus TaxID=1908235 RepID=UPI000ABFD1C9